MIGIYIFGIARKTLRTQLAVLCFMVFGLGAVVARATVHGSRSEYVSFKSESDVAAWAARMSHRSGVEIQIKTHDYRQLSIDHAVTYYPVLGSEAKPKITIDHDGGPLTLSGRLKLMSGTAIHGYGEISAPHDVEYFANLPHTYQKQRLAHLAIANLLEYGVETNIAEQDKDSAVAVLFDHLENQSSVIARRVIRARLRLRGGVLRDSDALQSDIMLDHDGLIQRSVLLDTVVVPAHYPTTDPEEAVDQGSENGHEYAGGEGDPLDQELQHFFMESYLQHHGESSGDVLEQAISSIIANNPDANFSPIADDVFARDTIIGGPFNIAHAEFDHAIIAADLPDHFIPADPWHQQRTEKGTIGLNGRQRAVVGQHSYIPGLGVRYDGADFDEQGLIPLPQAVVQLRSLGQGEFGIPILRHNTPLFALPSMKSIIPLYQLDTDLGHVPWEKAAIDKETGRPIYHWFLVNRDGTVDSLSHQAGE